MKQKLVDYLVNSELVEQKGIQRCVLRASLDDEASVVDEMIEQLDVDEGELAESMARFWGLEVWDESASDVDPGVLEFIPGRLAKKFGVLPLANDPEEGFQIAVYDVEKAKPVIEKIRDKTGAAPSLYVGARGRILGGVERHYGQDESTPGQGIVRKQRRSRPERTTANPGDSSDTDGATGREPSPEAGPTRQVEVTEDNPFMDLVNQESEGPGGGDDGGDDSPPETRAMQADAPEFFADVDEEGDEESGDRHESGASTGAEDEIGDGGEAESDGEAGREVGDEEMDDLAGALEEFDAELADEDSEGEEEELGAATSSVHWGEYRDDDESAFPGLEGDASSPSSPDVDAVTPDPSGRGDSEASGVFPVEDRGEEGDDFFDFPESEGGEELTLAEVVDRQRHIIQKLEREIEYQKGILQTMAELLVESRVISKSTLKKRLRQFKEEQRRKSD